MKPVHVNQHDPASVRRAIQQLSVNQGVIVENIGVVLPPQAGQAGNVLGTNGTTLSWVSQIYYGGMLPLMNGDSALMLDPYGQCVGVPL
jgi:hypothetical protein